MTKMNDFLFGYEFLVGSISKEYLMVCYGTATQYQILAITDIRGITSY